MITVSLSLGYLNLPIVIEHSLFSCLSKYDQPSWHYSSTLSVAFFVDIPPVAPTLSKHVLKLMPTATQEQQELYQLLATSLAYDHQEKTDKHAIILFTASSLTDSAYLGILSFAEQQPSLSPSLSLQVIRQSTSLTSQRTIEVAPVVDMETWSTYPMEIISLCQQYHTGNQDALPHLKMLTSKISGIAKLYGYWDLWRVLEGICSRFQIDPQHLLQ